jgi:Ca2+-binding EF-hand superfamily protein
MGDQRHKAQDTLRERATELFSLCDQEDKGFITENDLVQVISELGLPLDSKQVEQAFSKLDNDQNGYLTLEEFIEGFGLFLGLDLDDNANPELEEIATSDPGRELFYLCDTDRKGYITKIDLQRVAIDLNLNFDQLDLIFDKLDQDGNGKLTLDEFADGFGNFLNGVDTEEESNGFDEHDDGIEVEVIEPEPSRDVFESNSHDDPLSNTKEDAVFREVVESIGEDVLSG